MEITPIRIAYGFLAIAFVVFLIAALTVEPTPHPAHIKIIDTVGYNTDSYYHRYTVTFEDENDSICSHEYSQDEIRMISDKVVIGRTSNNVFTAKETFNKETGELLTRVQKKKTRTKNPTKMVTEQQGLY